MDIEQLTEVAQSFDRELILVQFEGGAEYQLRYGGNLEAKFSVSLSPEFLRGFLHGYVASTSDEVWEGMS